MPVDRRPFSLEVQTGAWNLVPRHPIMVGAIYNEAGFPG